MHSRSVFIARTYHKLSCSLLSMKMEWLASFGKQYSIFTRNKRSLSSQKNNICHRPIIKYIYASIVCMIILVPCQKNTTMIISLKTFTPTRKIITSQERVKSINNWIRWMVRYQIINKTVSYKDIFLIV